VINKLNLLHPIFLQLLCWLTAIFTVIVQLLLFVVLMWSAHLLKLTHSKRLTQREHRCDEGFP